MEQKFEQFLNECIDKFLAIISGMCREGFEYDKEYSRTYKSGFAMFEVADALYYKSKYQEEYMEWMIRDQLINESLNYLFKTHGYDIRWRLRNECHTTGGFTNKENESTFPVEFFLVIDGKYIAFRYTSFDADYSIPMKLPSGMKLCITKRGWKQFPSGLVLIGNVSQKKNLLKKRSNERY